MTKNKLKKLIILNNAQFASMHLNLLVILYIFLEVLKQRTIFPTPGCQFLEERCNSLVERILCDTFVTLHRILMLKVRARARHAFTLKQKNLF